MNENSCWVQHVLAGNAYLYTILLQMIVWLLWQMGVPIWDPLVCTIVATSQTEQYIHLPKAEWRTNLEFGNLWKVGMMRKGFRVLISASVQLSPLQLSRHFVIHFLRFTPALVGIPSSWVDAWIWRPCIAFAPANHTAQLALFLTQLIEQCRLQAGLFESPKIWAFLTVHMVVLKVKETVRLLLAVLFVSFFIFCNVRAMFWMVMDNIREI